MDFQLNDLMLDDLARLIAARLSSDALWDAADVAAYLGCSKRYVADYYATLPDFPRAIRPPSESGRSGHPRWEASDIKAWARKFKEAPAVGRPRKTR